VWPWGATRKAKWSGVKAACDAFDTANAAHAAVLRREASLHVSCSQPGSGAWLRRLPDVSVRGSEHGSALFLVELQRRLGLYVSALTAPLDERARRGRHAVTQHHRLGDAAANAANATARHNDGLDAVYRALVNGSLSGVRHQLGDRGDGTPLGKQEALVRWDHVCPGYVPDVLERDPHGDGKWGLFEFKCYSPHFLNGATGTRGGPCATDGADVAFGNTLEKLVVRVLGNAARNPSAARLHDRATGQGRVVARQGNYAGALGKGHRVTLLATESTGALAPATARLLKRLAANVARGDAVDCTVYGSGKASPRDFLSHHTAALSSALVAADANNVLAAAAALDHRLVSGRHGE
jgi:hypothetical protein